MKAISNAVFNNAFSYFQGCKYYAIAIGLVLEIDFLSLDLINKVVWKKVVNHIVCAFSIGFYFTFTLYVTLFMRPFGSRRELEFRPFHIFMNWETEGVYLIENILFFIPMGIFLFTWLQSVKKTCFSAMLISLLIESFQYILAVGKTEVDDVLLNTFGALLGCLVCLTLKRIYLIYRSRRPR